MLLHPELCGFMPVENFLEKGFWEKLHCKTQRGFSEDSTWLLRSAGGRWKVWVP
jgi:hypothetical protein